jgi:hypothetical protein
MSSELEGESKVTQNQFVMRRVIDTLEKNANKYNHYQEICENSFSDIKCQVKLNFSLKFFRCL